MLVTLQGFQKAAAGRYKFLGASKKKYQAYNFDFATQEKPPKTRAPSIQSRLERPPQAAIMSAEKRSASDDHGSSQMVVKRPNLGKDSKAVTVVNGSRGNGALIQAVCIVSEAPRLVGRTPPMIKMLMCVNRCHGQVVFKLLSWN